MCDADRDEGGSRFKPATIGPFEARRTSSPESRSREAPFSPMKGPPAKRMPLAPLSSARRTMGAPLRLSIAVASTVSLIVVQHLIFRQQSFRPLRYRRLACGSPHHPFVGRVQRPMSSCQTQPAFGALILQKFPLHETTVTFPPGSI
jgi:hypothetical protein